MVFSQDYGIEKPDPRLFQIAVEKAGCSIQQLLHVGDSLTNDITGSMAAGIKSVWLNRKRENPTDFTADYEITSLAELLEILE